MSDNVQNIEDKISALLKERKIEIENENWNSADEISFEIEKLEEKMFKLM